RLSGGERQRVAIAAAVAQQAQVMLLDEPTSALDPAHAISVMTLLQELPKRPAILMVCHDIQLAARYAKRIVLMKQGCVYADGKPEEVMTPANIDRVYGCDAQVLRDDHGALCIALRQK
ncbi:MAG: ABC transporter ATP-binding protein, partial [Lentisphaerae bacterium]|nr:ABC transporter ATP-binding protein [Lentisphaerota bacterium]